MNKTQFQQDTASRQMTVTRTFDAPQAQVWKAWTDPQIMDQWWAPAPWKAKTKSMDFRPGGTWLYSMNGPDGEQHWSRADFKEINPITSYSAADMFTDEMGNPNPEMPVMQWTVHFAPKGSQTEVKSVISYQSEEDMLKIVEMGFKEGFEAAHQNLDKLLAAGTAA